MFDFLKRSQLVKRGLASRQDAAAPDATTNCCATWNTLRYAKCLIFAAFVAGLAFLIFSGQQPEPTKNFVIALLFFATAMTQLWINQPKTFSRSSRLLLVFGVIFVQLAVDQAACSCFATAELHCF